MRVFSRLFGEMMRAARHAARHNPTHEGIYPVALLMDAKGNVVCDERGMPVVTLVPLNVVSIDGRTVCFEYIEQMASPKTVASIADVHVATVNRAVKAGELPKPAQISSRRVAHHMADVRLWLAKRTAVGR
jgi:predicted DNA-binding transcriptional regulator AlpA